MCGLAHPLEPTWAWRRRQPEPTRPSTTIDSPASLNLAIHAPETREGFAIKELLQGRSASCKEIRRSERERQVVSFRAAPQAVAPKPPLSISRLPGEQAIPQTVAAAAHFLSATAQTVPATVRLRSASVQSAGATAHFLQLACHTASIAYRH